MSESPRPQPDPQPEKPAAETREPVRPEPSAPADHSPPTPPKFVFKITKADPKNSFDFEDVADK
jgi:hypothetical protein